MNAASHVPSGVLISTSVSTMFPAASAGRALTPTPAATEKATNSRRPRSAFFRSSLIVGSSSKKSLSLFRRRDISEGRLVAASFRSTGGGEEQEDAASQRQNRQSHGRFKQSLHKIARWRRSADTAIPFRDPCVALACFVDQSERLPLPEASQRRVLAARLAGGHHGLELCNSLVTIAFERARSLCHWVVCGYKAKGRVLVVPGLNIHGECLGRGGFAGQKITLFVERGVP